MSFVELTVTLNTSELGLPTQSSRSGLLNKRHALSHTVYFLAKSLYVTVKVGL